MGCVYCLGCTNLHLLKNMIPTSNELIQEKIVASPANMLLLYLNPHNMKEDLPFFLTEEKNNLGFQNTMYNTQVN